MHQNSVYFVRLAASLAVWLSAAFIVGGCSPGASATTAVATAQAPAGPQVNVARVITKEVTDFDEFTGKFVAVEHVAVRPRVTGYISNVSLAPGGEVRKGDILFTIDQRPYQAELKRAQAELTRARAQLALSHSERERATRMLEQRAISREEFDSRVSDSDQAEANVQAAAAALDVAQLNFSFTQVRSPIAGRVSREEVTEGNLVTAGQTLLTTVVSVDRIYVEFNGDEQVFLRYAELARKGEMVSTRDPETPVWVGLADEAGTPHEGRIVFLDNALDPQTGTIRARALLDNSERLYTPGLFARVKLQGSGAYSATLVNDSAIGTDQNVRYVFAVGAGNRLEYRPVQLGGLVDGLRVIRSGLRDGETVVVNGLQRVRPGIAVVPQLIAMGEHKAADTMVASN